LSDSVTSIGLTHRLNGANPSAATCPSRFDRWLAAPFRHNRRRAIGRQRSLAL